MFEPVSQSQPTPLAEPAVMFPRRKPLHPPYLRDFDHYQSLYQQSLTDPATFWGEMAQQNLTWFEPWKQTLLSDWSQIGRVAAPYTQWFVGGKLNISYNCLDRHLTSERRDQVALLWQGESPLTTQTYTYAELHREVCRFAQVLRKHGVGKGDTVTIFLPQIPSAAIAMLACLRIGAIHSVVFSAFSAEALASRIHDCKSRMVITADIGRHAGKVIPLKATVDQALTTCPAVTKVIVYQQGDTPTPETSRDILWQTAMQDPSLQDTYPAEPLDAEDPAFILYTSGSTGKPKAVMHTTAGYLLYAHLTFKYIFNAHPGQIHFCTADVGWITGHSYVIYGPLSVGVTTIMFEGTPTFPNPDRYWQVIQNHGVQIFYTAPTAIRALMRFGDDWPAAYDLSSLEVLGSVGEPIMPKAWQWFFKVIGRERCPVVDTWWQTETGGIMITPLAHITPLKPGSAGRPFFGVSPKVLRSDGTPAPAGEDGSLVITAPWPGMLRGTYGDTTHTNVKKAYFSTFPNVYYTGDGSRQDSQGDYWLLGRIDDVINVSAHRFATAEIESALVSHPAVVEAAVVGIPHEIKGQGIYCFVTLQADITPSAELKQELTQHVRQTISPIATPHVIQFAVALPKTRSGKIMRRILRKIAAGEADDFGNISTLADPDVIQTLWQERENIIGLCT